MIPNHTDITLRSLVAKTTSLKYSEQSKMPYMDGSSSVIGHLPMMEPFGWSRKMEVIPLIVMSNTLISLQIKTPTSFNCSEQSNTQPYWDNYLFKIKFRNSFKKRKKNPIIWWLIKLKRGKNYFQLQEFTASNEKFNFGTAAEKYIHKQKTVSKPRFTSISRVTWRTSK